MNLTLFLVPLLTSFVIATLILVAMILWGYGKKICDKRVEQRHLHKNGVLRFGGVAIILAFVMTICVDQNIVIDSRLKGVLIASVLVLLFGFVDDLRQISWKWQLLFQIAIVFFVYVFGVKLAFVSNPFGEIFLFETFWGLFLSFAIATVWIVFIINAINWMDGIDGAAGGVSFIGVITIFLLSFRPEVNQPPIAIITAAILGGLLAFLVFNFYPAKIMAGTSGSMFMGFALAILAIFAGAKIATTLLVLTIPIVDALWVIVERLRAGQSIFSADKRHLHFRLLELGWAPKQICYFYYAATALVALIALNTHAFGKFVAFIVFVLLIVCLLFLLHQKKFNV